jgi:hypothetical protein
MSLLLWSERPLNPPCCRECGDRDVYKLGLCEDHYNELAEASIEAEKEKRHGCRVHCGD